MISEIWLLLQCAVALQRADADLHKCDHVGGGVWRLIVRLTAKPRYLLLLHRGKEKSNTVTALVLLAGVNMVSEHLHLTVISLADIFIQRNNKHHKYL